MKKQLVALFCFAGIGTGFAISDLVLYDAEGDRVGTVLDTSQRPVLNGEPAGMDVSIIVSVGKTFKAFTNGLRSQARVSCIAIPFCSLGRDVAWPSNS